METEKILDYLDVDINPKTPEETKKLLRSLKNMGVRWASHTEIDLDKDMLKVSPVERIYINLNRGKLAYGFLKEYNHRHEDLMTIDEFYKKFNVQEISE